MSEQEKQSVEDVPELSQWLKARLEVIRENVNLERGFENERKKDNPDPAVFKALRKKENEIFRKRGAKLR